MDLLHNDLIKIKQMENGDKFTPNPFFDEDEIANPATDSKSGTAGKGKTPGGIERSEKSADQSVMSGMHRAGANQSMTSKFSG